MIFLIQLCDAFLHVRSAVVQHVVLKVMEVEGRMFVACPKPSFWNSKGPSTLSKVILHHMSASAAVRQLASHDGAAHAKLVTRHA